MRKILYIAGWGRSGTTILDNLLGQVDGFVSTGELHHLWQRGILDGRDCGCGLPLAECDVWRQVFQAGFGGLDHVDARAVVRSQEAIHTRDARAVLRARERGSMLSDFEYAGHLKRLYDGLAESTGARVIVDSSKYPTDAIVAAGLPGYEVWVVHMVRDPRAVAFSWQRHKPVQDKAASGGMLRRVGSLRSTLVWQLYNTTIAGSVRRAVGDDHYRVLRYERLADEPEAVLRELLHFVGAPDAAAPAFTGGTTVTLARTHTASGNPGRFRAGATTFRLDDEWRSAMPGWKRAGIAALAYPTISRLAGAGR
ncbi:sulfotransferase [Jatrophihabitans endophyticus]|uniref:sulfotransferase n=1 Tax=Jatrophihabitans endophyticus TaxID=1206085 RepID=UPI0019E57092|nr:sulfotransferase [Jatrophihabitans endophyticus]MBE7189074.1 sulfotransferase [Jatrophihabitans endophyticus]